MPKFEVSSASPLEVEAELLVLPFFKGRSPGPGVKEVQDALGTDLMATLAEHRVQGKVGDVFTLPTLGKLRAKNVMLLGLGPKEDAGPSAVRKAVMRASRSAGRFGTVATTVVQVGDGTEDVAHAFVEGAGLGTYRFDRYKERPIDEPSQEKSRLRRVIVLAGAGDSAATIRGSMRRGEVYAEAANWARDLVNTPAIDATPAYLADEARSMAGRAGLESRVWTKAELKRGGFGGVLGVGAGSVNDPRVIELTHRGAGDASPIAVTGKGITFDSGGLSIKDAAGMEHMKIDMAGAAAALAIMQAVAQLKPKVNVVAAIPFAENMPGGSAIRPGDVLRHRGGKTSEVLNTDAEGRLVLADVLAYLSEKKPAAIIDMATLTGAAMIALGMEIWAVIGNDRALVDGLLAAGRAEGEPGWELPLWTDYRRLLESAVADIKNTGGRYGGAINAALFLKEFVGDVPWAHIDIAGPAFTDGNEFWPKGATGIPARSVIRFIEDRAAAGDGGRARSRSSARSSARPATAAKRSVRPRAGAAARGTRRRSS